MHADTALPGSLCLPLQALPQDVCRHGHQHRQRAAEESKLRSTLAFAAHTQVLYLETNAGACHAGVGNGSSSPFPGSRAGSVPDVELERPERQSCVGLELGYAASDFLFSSSRARSSDNESDPAGRLARPAWRISCPNVVGPCGGRGSLLPILLRIFPQLCSTCGTTISGGIATPPPIRTSNWAIGTLAVVGPGSTPR